MWLSFKLRDGRIGVCHEADVKSAAADPAHSFAKVQFQDGAEDEIIDAQGHYTLAEALAVMFSAMAANVRTCRVCGCTDDDCSQCVERTGKPCSWVEDDLCSACSIAAPAAILGEPALTHPAHAREVDKALREAARMRGENLVHPMEAHMKEQTGIAEASSGALVHPVDAAAKLAALPETRQLPIAHGQGLSPLQDGNHPEIEAHRRRLGEATGDPMASAKALLARKDAKP